MQNDLLIPIWGMAIIFLFVAFIYSSIGLGGGTSYTAIMVIAGVIVAFIPTISLLLNVLVSSLGTYHFIRNKHFETKLVLPFLITSMPMSFIGGSLSIEKEIIQLVLLTSLILIALRIYIWDHISLRINLNENQQLFVSLSTGAVLGLIAGIAGIGGGIYLIPLILFFNLGTIKQAAACAVIFVFLNSIMGLFGRFNHNYSDEIYSYWPLILAVILGGFLGSRLGSSSLSPLILQKLLGVIVLIAIIFLIIK